MTLPQGWAETTLGEIASIRNSKADPATLSGQPFIGLEHIEAHTSRLLKNGIADDVKSAVVTFAMGDVLFGRLRPYLNKVIEAPFDGCASAELIPFVAQEGIDKVLLRRWIMSPDFMSFTASLDQGDRPRVKGDDLKAYPIHLPPLAEQRRIVAKLDALTARLTRARAELDRVPMLAEKLRTAILKEVFVGHSETMTLRSLTSFVTSGSRGWAKYYSDDGPIFIRVGDIRRRNILLDLEDVQKVSPPEGAEGARTSLVAGDIVVTITADLGRVGIVTEDLGPAFVNQHVALVRPNDIETSSWIGWYLCSDPGQQQMLAKDRGVTKAGLGLDDIRNVHVPVPDEATRLAGLQRIQSTFARADRLEAEAAKARALLDRLEAAILAKAFRGELVPQDLDDEPAQVLLDRIRAERAAAPKPKRGRRKAA